MKKIIITAVVLRILVAIFIFHPDIKTINYQTSFLRHGVFNIYTYLVNNKESLPLKENFVYFPLTYVLLGGYQSITAPLLGVNFDSWLANADSVGMVTDPNIFGYLLALKLPYMFFDIGVAFLLLRYFKDEGLGKKAFTLWLFNPFTIFIIYGFGNVDIFPVFLTMLSLLFIKNKRNVTAACVLGLAAGFKIYPLLFVPFLILSGKSAKEKILFSVIPLGVFGLISLPFISSSFLQSTLISGLTTRMFNPGFSVGFGESIIVGMMLLSALFFYAWIKDRNINLLNYWFAVLGIIFAFSHFHIAWLLWIAPFAAILVIKNTKISTPVFLLSILGVLIPFLYQDRSMSISLFRIYSVWFDLLPTPFTSIQRVFDPYNLQSILHSLLAGGIGILVFRMFKKEDKNNSSLNK